MQEMLNLSQQDYVNRIEELNSRLILAWDQDQRVKALKIAIQVVKHRVNYSRFQTQNIRLSALAFCYHAHTNDTCPFLGEIH